MLCSWPLPHAITRSPRRASEHANASARPRSITRQKVSPSTPPRRRQPCGHLVQDARQRLGARILRGEHGHVGQLRADLGHQAALLAIAQPGAAKDRDHPAVGGNHRPRRLQRALAARWACAQNRQSPGNPAPRRCAPCGRESGARRAIPSATAARSRPTSSPSSDAAGRHRRQQVRHVERPHQPRLDALARMPRPHHRAARRVRAIIDASTRTSTGPTGSSA